MLKLHIWTDYIIRKGFILADLLLAAGIVLHLYIRHQPLYAPILRDYAQHYSTSAAIVLAAALFGALFLEDILRKSR